MKIFVAFIVMVASALLLNLPITQTSYDFRTEPRTDTEPTVTTVAWATSANVVLDQPIYDDDTGTVSILSDDATDAPVVSSYNSSNRQLVVAGLAGGATRELDVTYDIDALNAGVAIGAIIDKTPWFWLLLVLMLPAVGIAAMFWDKIRGRLG